MHREQVKRDLADDLVCEEALVVLDLDDDFALNELVARHVDREDLVLVEEDGAHLRRRGVVSGGRGFGAWTRRRRRGEACSAARVSGGSTHILVDGRALRLLDRAGIDADLDHRIDEIRLPDGALEPPHLDEVHADLVRLAGRHAGAGASRGGVRGRTCASSEASSSWYTPSKFRLDRFRTRQLCAERGLCHNPSLYYSFPKTTPTPPHETPPTRAQQRSLVLTYAPPPGMGMGYSHQAK